MTQKMSLASRLLVLVLALSLPVTALAQQRQTRPDRGQPQRPAQQQPEQPDQSKGEASPNQAQAKSGLLRLLPDDSVTQHSIDLTSGKKLGYTATAGTLALYDQSGEQTAAVFYTAYVAKDGDSNRPLTFAFNGGPGAASAYLHLGLVGPKILQFGDRNDAATAQLRSNPQTWLEFTDLVLIDPVDAGWSRAAKANGENAFRGVARDADFFAKVIALYVNKNARGNSPKFLLGESYGGFRAAKVSRALLKDQGIAVSGIVMVSPFLESIFTFGGDKFPLGAALSLPSVIASELERTNSMSKGALTQAERFSMTEYLITLAGPPPQGEEARAFYGKLAKMTGIPEADVTKSRGLLRDHYLRGLSSADGMVASRYDASVLVNDPYPESRGNQSPDPVLDGFTRAYAGAFVNYAREELGFRTDMTYTLLAGGNWDWREGGRDPGVSDDLRILLTLSPSFRLLIGHGYTDLVTPYMASRYVIEHLPPLTPPGRAELKVYPGGHMFYTVEEARRNFTADAKEFFATRKGS